jgi:hypothetical protein
MDGWAFLDCALWAGDREDDHPDSYLICEEL